MFGSSRGRPCSEKTRDFDILKGPRWVIEGLRMCCFQTLSLLLGDCKRFRMPAAAVGVQPDKLFGSIFLPRR